MLKKSLLYKDYKRLFELIISMLIVFLMTYIQPIYEGFSLIKKFNIVGNEAFTYAVDSLFNSEVRKIIIMLVILIFANSLMSDVKAKQQSLVLTMPFTRKDIILNKMYFGLIAIVSCTLISFVIVIITLYLNHELLSNYIDILILAKWFIISLITNITVFSLSILVELIIGNRTLSFIVSMIMVFYPAGFCFMLGTLLSRPYSEQILHTGSVIIPSALSNSNIINNQHYITNYGIKIIVLVILSTIFVLLALYAFKKLRIEKSSRFIMFKPMENFFMCGFSISLWVPFIFILGSSSIIPSSNILALKIIALIFAITIGIFSSRAMFKHIK